MMTGRKMEHQTGTRPPSEVWYERNWAERTPLRRRVPRTVLRPFGSVAALVLLFAAFTAQAEPAVANATCPNEALRVGQLSTYLPDCRAYEQIAPSAKDSSEPLAVPVGLHEHQLLESIEGAQTSVDGNRIAWDSEYALPGSVAPGLDYLSTRGDEGWSTKNVIPPQSPANGVLCPNLVGIVAWSSDMSKGVLADGFGQENPTESFLGEGLECGHDEPRLVQGEPEGFQNLFLRDSASDSYELVNVTPSGLRVPKPTNFPAQQYFSASFLAGSSDLTHVIFEEELKLTQNAPIGFPGGDELYEWSGGEVRLVTVLPNGTPVHGALAGATPNTLRVSTPTSAYIPVNIANVRHAVSADGSLIFFEAEDNLYARESGTSTAQIDASQGGGPGGGGRFMAANAEGTRVFFTDDASAGLTPDTAAGSGVNLYEYDVTDASLKDLTVASEASVQGVSGTSEDGAYVYFVADGVLTGNQGNSRGARAEAGKPNLYAFHNGVTTFITTLDASADSCDWTSNTGCSAGSVPFTSGLTARVSTNGAFIGFNSVKSLTGYDNVDANTHEADSEIFLYEGASNSLRCTSCNANGSPSSGGAAIRYPALPDTNSETRNGYPQRNVSDAGQVFFETNEALLPQDTNGQRDVYEYERGALHLVSSGTSEAGSFFLDSTPSGSDVFFATAQPLLRSDTDEAFDYYDARVGGGFVEPPAPVPPCESEACKGTTPAVPALMSPGSVSFAGVGNLISPVKTSVRRQKVVRLRLRRALRACRRGHRRNTQRRRLCEREARRRYGGSVASIDGGVGSAQGNRRVK